MQFNEKLKELRLKKGISQTALAEKIFVSRSAVAKWENGLGLPSDDSLNQLAEFFGVEPSELLSDPTMETVIVTKNSTISKQKLWIISISVFAVIAAIVLIALCSYFATRSTTPIVSRYMIFETEKELDIDGLNSYTDDEISTDCIFSNSRTFEIKQSVGAIRLPKLLVKTVTNGVVSYETVDSSSVIFTCSENISLKYEKDKEYGNSLYVNVLPTDYYAVEFCEWANIKYGDLLISIKVFRNHIAVESVTVGFSDNSSEIGLTKSKVLSCNIKPYDANYTKFAYTIDSIIRPNGEKYDGNLTDYAYIDNHYLTTTKNIEIGSVINLFAVTDYDNIKSNVFTVTVTRVDVERITLTLPNTASHIFLGESQPLTFNIYPDNASFNVLEEQAIITLLTPELATLEQTESGWLLTASNNKNRVGEKIEIKVEMPEGATQVFYWTISKIQIESLMLINLDTGEELNEVTYINRNGTLRLIGIVTPENATYDKISYNIFVDMPNFGRYVQISDDGILTVSDNAPLDMEIFISVTAGTFRGNSYKIIVKQA
ncbi:MAG: helix-turn-helix domain-containing protein [Clostridiales bacterium]|nr:helix-turn-helix domain-containing protein [Clostridiales bacterium]